MKILIIGAGPAGLTLAYTLKKNDSKHSVQVVERRNPKESAGWGVTFSADSLKGIDYDLDLHRVIKISSVSYKGQEYLKTQVNLMTLARDALLEFLRERCLSVGVDLRFNDHVKTLSNADMSSFDLLVGADGVNSCVRKSFSKSFGPTIIRSTLNHAWMATPKLFGERLANTFQASDEMLFNAWGYQYSESLSSFIVQCTSSGLKKSGLEDLSDEACCSRIARIFEKDLEGRMVIAAKDFRWNTFELLKNKTWHHQNVVIIGDAAHTTHFSKGYGTILAIQDAICLSRHLTTSMDVKSALISFEQERKPEVDLQQSTAIASQNWYETVLRLYETGSTSAVLDAIALAQSSIEFSGLKLT